MDRHMNRLHALAAYMLGDAVMAEDVCQTVFIKTWEMAPTWTQGQAKLITWMRRVTTHQCLDILKKHSPVYPGDVPDVEDMHISAVDDMIANEEAMRVKLALDQLGYRQKAAIILSYYDQQTQKDAASIMQISESAYESLLVRARKTLKKKLTRPGDQPRNVEFIYDL